MLDIDSIKRRREKLGMSMEQAASAAGLSGRQQWYDVESGRRKSITLVTLGRIAGALKCKPADLLMK